MIRLIVKRQERVLTFAALVIIRITGNRGINERLLDTFTVFAFITSLAVIVAHAFTSGN